MSLILSSSPLPPSLSCPSSIPLSLLLSLPPSLLSLPPAPLLPPSADRLKGIAGAALQTGGELADNDIIAAVADAAANQITADDDATVGERIGMLAEDITAGVTDAGLVSESTGQVLKDVSEAITNAAETT